MLAPLTNQPTNQTNQPNQPPFLPQTINETGLDPRPLRCPSSLARRGERGRRERRTPLPFYVLRRRAEREKEEQEAREAAAAAKLKAGAWPAREPPRGAGRGAGGGGAGPVGAVGHAGGAGDHLREQYVVLPCEPHSSYC